MIRRVTVLILAVALLLPLTGWAKLAGDKVRIGVVMPNAGIFIDWAPAYFLSWSLFPTAGGADPFVTLAIFAALQYAFMITLNGSIGHIATRMRVVPIRGGYLGFWRPLVRTLLLCLVIPAVIWDVDQRGLHDRAAGTVLVRV